MLHLACRRQLQQTLNPHILRILFNLLLLLGTSNLVEHTTMRTLLSKLSTSLNLPPTFSLQLPTPRNKITNMTISTLFSKPIERLLQIIQVLSILATRAFTP